MSRAERLTTERERDLVIAAETGDPEACRALVEAFLPAIGGLARRFPGGIGVERQELVQEGVAGLLFAARRYDAASARRSGRTRRSGCARRCRSSSRS